MCYLTTDGRISFRFGWLLFDMKGPDDGSKDILRGSYSLYMCLRLSTMSHVDVERSWQELLIF